MTNYWKARKMGASRKEAWKMDKQQTKKDMLNAAPVVLPAAVFFSLAVAKPAMAKAPASFNNAAVKINTAGSLATKPEGLSVGFGMDESSTTGKLFFNKKLGVGSAEVGACPFILAKNGPVKLRIQSVHFGAQIPFYGKIGIGYVPQHTSVNDNGSWDHSMSMWHNSSWGVNTGVQVANMATDPQVTISAEGVLANRIVISGAYKIQQAQFIMGADGQVWVIPLRFSITTKEGETSQFDLGGTIPLGEGTRIKIDGKDVTGKNPEISITVETPLPF
ncbi:hypothetical protein KO465_05970 [Candidatus Micrarchaeota archaeon]|nr:hypothetical protein [Candidatus Micrarchaeota archaeon]